MKTTNHEGNVGNIGHTGTTTQGTNTKATRRNNQTKNQYEGNTLHTYSFDFIIHFTQKS
jgi:hypothetical protein